MNERLRAHYKIRIEWTPGSVGGKQVEPQTEHGDNSMMEHEPRDAARSEYDICRAWHAGAFRQRGLTTTTGQPITVIYPGNWTHNFGPDFHGALVAFGAELRRGDVEIHSRSSGWRAHGHDSDARYNEVILHAVLVDDRVNCLTTSGRAVPVTILPIDAVPAAGAYGASPPWLATTPCVARAPASRFPEILAELNLLGDARLAAKVARLEGALTLETPAQVLYAGLLEGLGYRHNVEPMQRLATIVPLERIDALAPVGAGGWLQIAALLLGAAGLLDSAVTAAGLALTPDELLSLRANWDSSAGYRGGESLTLADWTRARTRPANYPERRLLGFSQLLATCQPDGLLPSTRAAIVAAAESRGTRDVRELLGVEGAERRWRLGQDRAGELAINFLLPFAIAYGSRADDDQLMEAAARLWERYPATASNAVARRFVSQISDNGLQLRTARQQQGALRLYQQLCERRRCHECPLARLGRL